MSTSADRASQRYLPQALRDAGYRTVFMQATDMEFMMMDQFMVTAGFENTYSDQDYPDAKLRTGWGVDDNTLFTQVSQRIRELEKEPRPAIPHSADLRQSSPLRLSGARGLP